jgi:hypothetical protein
VVPTSLQRRRPTGTLTPPARLLLRSGPWRLFLTYWGSLVLVDATRDASRLAGTLALGALAAAFSSRQRPAVAAGLALVVWLFVTGFVVNSGGQIAVHGAPDLERLAALLAVATLAARLTRTGERAR